MKQPSQLFIEDMEGGVNVTGMPCFCDVDERAMSDREIVVSKC